MSTKIESGQLLRQSSNILPELCSIFIFLIFHEIGMLQKNLQDESVLFPRILKTRVCYLSDVSTIIELIAFRFSDCIFYRLAYLLFLPSLASLWCFQNKSHYLCLRIT